MYLSFAKLAFRQNSTYKTNSLMYIISSMLSIMVQVSIWTTLYKNNNVVNGVTLQDMLTYTLLTTLISVFAATNIGERLAERVRTGEIAGDFVRPVRLKYFLISEQIGSTLYKFLFSVTPVFVISLFFVSFTIPSDPIVLVLFIVSVILGFILSNSMMYSLGLLVFWLKDSGYVRWFNKAFTLLFGGAAVPLWFYPENFRLVANYLPWRLISYEPISIYLEKVSGIAAWHTILLQIVWIILFDLLGIYIWKKVQKYVFVQGG